MFNQFDVITYTRMAIFYSFLAAYRSYLFFEPSFIAGNRFHSLKWKIKKIRIRTIKIHLLGIHSWVKNSKFVVLFWLIFFINFISIRIYRFPLTSIIQLRLGIGVFVWRIITLNWILKHPISFVQFLVPAATPLVLVPFVWIIELVRVLTRPLIIGLRLAINISVGHVLIGLARSFRFSIINNFIFFNVQILLLAIELIISFIQAYVFILLLIFSLEERFH